MWNSTQKKKTKQFGVKEIAVTLKSIDVGGGSWRNISQNVWQSVTWKPPQ